MSPRAMVSRLARRVSARVPHRRFAVPIVGCTALLLNAAVSTFIAPPEPAFHDEFSYLLAADTFAAGRLTNPTHPMWVHFESFHIIHEPSYQSKHPPAQGLVLAAGQVLGGHPMVGLWIASALSCAAVCWMLQAWMPPRWAFVGGMAVALHPTLTAWWGQTYWGGAVAMLGGALVYGALPRLLRRPRIRHALLMGVGFSILANSRPFEGLVATLPAAVLILTGILRKEPPDRSEMARQVLVPIAAVALAAGSFMGYYHYRVTGNPFLTPYRVWLDTYQGPETVHRHRELREYTGSPELTVSQKLRRLRAFYLPLPLLVPLIMLPWMLRSWFIRFALLVCLVEVAMSVSVSRAWPHYAAPVAGLVFVLVARGMGYLYHFRWRGWGLRWLVWSLAFVYVASLIVFYVRREPAIWFQTWNLARAHMLEMLEEGERFHLVMVRYAPDHDVHREWVYNRADIDDAKVVWAREMSREQNLELFDYFRYRRIWLLEADGSPPRLQPYPPALVN